MKIAFIGAGAYGLSMALMAHENNHKIKMWTKFEDDKRLLQDNQVSINILNGRKMPNGIEYTTSIEECIKDSDLIMIMVAAGYVDDVSKELKKHYKDQYVCIGSKGIEQDTCLFVADVFKKHVKTDKLAVISGPSFAVDIASYVPIGITLASENLETFQIVKEALENKNLKIRTTDDIVGVEICGSIKNIMAIASGIIAGLGLPESTRAMLIVEAMHDIKELIYSLGGNKKTIMSYAGIGDLLLTCTSIKSRNFKFGKMVGSNLPKSELDEYVNNTTVEGLYTLKSIYKLIKDKEVNMPIIDIMYQIVINNKDVSLLTDFLISKK